jgi:hypothetical protein
MIPKTGLVKITFAGMKSKRTYRAAPVKLKGGMGIPPYFLIRGRDRPARDIRRGETARSRLNCVHSYKRLNFYLTPIFDSFILKTINFSSFFRIMGSAIGADHAVDIPVIFINS